MIKVFNLQILGQLVNNHFLLLNYFTGRYVGAASLNKLLIPIY